ncbi:6-phosphogluconolactonase [Micrococcales bacterium KH10]|nr:6-phosphogluconolactonase [Micrococcales bacterium KH10]
MSAPFVVVHPTADVLADAVAARLLTRIIDLQCVRAPVHIVVTGGTLGIGSLAAAARSSLLSAVDWSEVHIWWGDERFVPAGDADRNELQAREALLNLLVSDFGLPEHNIHVMPAAVDGLDDEQAALNYAAELQRYASPGKSIPSFDVLMLGVGPDAHVASLFPGHPGLSRTGATAGVQDSPKPPPTRVTLTFDTINNAREVWLIAAGAGKAEAVRKALSGAPVDEAPAGHVHGTERTLWLLDTEASN